MRLFSKTRSTSLIVSTLFILAVSVLIFTPIMAQGGTSGSQIEAKSSLVNDDPTPIIANNSIIVIEGPVSAININIITIYNFTVSVAPDNPILTVITIGSIVHIEGESDSTGVIVATVVTLTTADVTVNGVVSAINGNIVIVSGTTVQFDPDDPTLSVIQIGDNVNLDGNYQGSGTTLVFIVINVTIVNVNITVNPNLPSNCKISKNGHIKCSKKSH